MRIDSRVGYRLAFCAMLLAALSTPAAASPLSAVKSIAAKIGTATVHVAKTAVEVPVHAGDRLVDDITNKL